VGLDFRNVGDNITYFQITCYADAVYSQYLDAWANPADADYSEGDNLTPRVGYLDKIYINKDEVVNDICFLNALPPDRPVRIESFGVGYGFIDNFGGDWISGYIANDNWQRLYPWGWGKNHRDCLSGVYNLYERYFRNDKVFIGSTGVCV